MFRILLIEDDNTAAKELISLLGQYEDTHDIDFQISWLKTAIDFVSGERSYDLILLDIGLPGINGMEAAEMMRAYDPVTPIIFVTDLAKYAVKGYEVNALGFIVKPVRKPALTLHLDRAVGVWQRNLGKKITINTDEGMRVAPIADLIFVEVRNHELVWHLEGAEQLRERGSLKHVADKLDGSPVLRISKSHLINMSKVRSVQKDQVQMVSGDRLVISRSRRRYTIEQLTTYLGSGR